ncbi:polysaccharide intercellular adhesin biosynthesis/export protein IcaC [Staphylococcus coagulans]|uniref:polysaccharide intercellular adhesin biosynthesis/export protein IcaC n=1 Tax=Staphylococcus coagulans TaxID=74706 RepID=UPI00287209E2|nr:polysaccharide intercellular adhesin biosynthesis/export protein IcaC [Staphylococcus coagulans]MDR9833174.1 polysaccharide intercellular adhesin biosynthesis/export protein IcaC [Staphylococcus coagulans]
MKAKKIELIYLRAVTCMIIIFTHLLTEYMRQINGNQIEQLKLIYYVQNIFIFGTPSFMILTQLLTTLNYTNVTLAYLWGRIKYIFLPYILIGTFYCFSESKITQTPFLKQCYENLILGRWHGYFIIVILQFALLSYVLFKISPRIFDSKLILALSFALQYSFLHLLNTNQTFSQNFKTFYPLSENTFLIGWIFFFFLGAYIGRNYPIIVQFLMHYVFIVILLTMLAFLAFVLNQQHNYWNVTSFNENLIFYHLFMFLLLLALCLQFKQVMFDSVNLVSAFSFFIYLFHPIVLSSLYEYFKNFSDLTFVFIGISLLFTLGICIGVGLLLREFKIFRFVIGKQPYHLKINLT